VRILDVCPRVVHPPRRGAGIRTYNLLRHLSARHEVVQFSLPEDDPPALRPRIEESEITPTYRELRYKHPLVSATVGLGMRTWVNAPLLSGLALRLTRPSELTRLLAWADVVLVEFPWQFDYCSRRRPQGGLVLASHNVERIKFESWALAAEASLVRPWVAYIERMEARAAAEADLVLAVSAEERTEYIERYSVDPQRAVEIPNGADTERYVPVEREARRAARAHLGLPDRTTVVYAASAIPPNLRGAEWVRRVAEVADRFTFLAVGPGAAVDHAPANLVCTGLVEDIRPYFEAADIAVCPIEHGAGTKIKLLEYLACGLPTVAFPAALQGTAARDGVEVVAAEPTVEALRSAIERLADDPELAARIALGARALAVERYDWGRIAERLDEALTAAFGGEPASVGRRHRDRLTPGPPVLPGHRR